MTSNDAPTAKIFHDKAEMEAFKLYDKFMEEKNPEFLLQASELIKKSSNPKALQISETYRAWYFRELGVNEKNSKKAAEFLNKSLGIFKTVLPKDDDILKRIELEYLKNKLVADKKPQDYNDFLRRANLFKELGKETESNQDMTLYTMFYLLDKFKTLDKGMVDELLESMLSYAKKGSSPELLYKTEVIYHQIRADTSHRPKDRLKELKKAAEAIKNTSDKYGKDSTETEILMTKAMTIGNRKKRNKLLIQVAKNYKKAGLEKREKFVRNLAYPIPIKVATVIYLCNESIKKLRVVEKKLVDLKLTKGPAAIFYHIGYLLERIDNVEKIMIRLALSRKNLTDCNIQIQQLTPDKIIPGKPFSKRLQILHRKTSNLQKEMKLDMESLFIFGNLLLDQWSYIISYIAGYSVPEDKKSIDENNPDLNFAGLLDLLQAKDYKGELLKFWGLHKKDIIWLNFHLRAYRNIFVEHIRKPWQRGTTMDVFGDDFNFHIPSPVGYFSEEEKNKILKSVIKYAPKKLKDMPDDYWEKKNLHRALEVTLYYIDEIDSQFARSEVWNAWNKLGGSAPSYDRIAQRLLSYLYTSLDTIIKFIDENPKLIKFGEFK